MSFIGASGVLFLAVMFYFTLALMLSTISNRRGAALGIPMAILFAYQLVLSVAPWLGQIMPWGLTSPLGSNDNSITLALTLGTASRIDRANGRYPCLVCAVRRHSHMAVQS